MLIPYNVKIKVYCKDENEAVMVQKAINGISGDLNLIGGELLTFYAKYKQNEAVIKPALMDVFKNGVGAVSRHIFKLTKLK